jgi:hypothetical protein
MIVKAKESANVLKEKDHAQINVRANVKKNKIRNKRKKNKNDHIQNNF